MAKSKAVELLIKLKNETGQSFDEIQKDVDKLRKEEKDLEKQTKKNTKANKDNKKSLDSMKKGMTVLAGAATAAAAAYAAMAKASLESNQELIRQARLSNTSVEDFQALAGAASAFGVNADEVADAVNNLNLKVQEAALLDSGAFKDLTQLLGIDAKALAATDDSIKVLDTFQQALSNASAEQKKLFADEVGSDALIQLNALVDESNLTLGEQIEKQRELGKVLKEESVKSLQDLNVAFQDTKGIFDTQFKESLAEIAPYFEDLLNSLNESDGVQNINEEFSVFNKVILITVESLRILVNAFDSSFEIAQAIVKNAFSGIKLAIQLTVGYMVKIFSDIPNKVGAIFDSLIIKINESIIGIIESFNKLATKLNDDFAIGEGLINNLKGSNSRIESELKKRKEIIEKNNKAMDAAFKNTSNKYIDEATKDVTDTLSDMLKSIETNGDDLVEAITRVANPTKALKEIKVEKQAKELAEKLEAEAKKAKVSPEVKPTFNFTQAQQQLKVLQDSLTIIGQNSKLNLINPEQERLNLIDIQQQIVDTYEAINTAKKNNGQLLSQEDIINLNNAKIALQELQSQFQFTAEDSKELGTSIGGDLKGAFSDAITGAQSFQDAMSSALDNIINKLIEAILQQTIFNSLSQSLGGSSNSFLQGIGAAFGSAHIGGIAGQTTQTRNVSPTAFAFAQRYHTGGIAGLRPNEVPTILERGEEVLTANDPRHVNNYKETNNTQTIESKNQIIENNIAFGDEQINKLFSTDSARQAIADFINENPDKLNIR